MTRAAWRSFKFSCAWSHDLYTSLSLMARARVFAVSLKVSFTAAPPVRFDDGVERQSGRFPIIQYTSAKETPPLARKYPPGRPSISFLKDPIGYRFQRNAPGGSRRHRA